MTGAENGWGRNIEKGERRQTLDKGKGQQLTNDRLKAIFPIHIQTRLRRQLHGIHNIHAHLYERLHHHIVFLQLQSLSATRNASTTTITHAQRRTGRNFRTPGPSHKAQTLNPKKKIRGNGWERTMKRSASELIRPLFRHVFQMVGSVNPILRFPQSSLMRKHVFGSFAPAASLLVGSIIASIRATRSFADFAIPPAESNVLLSPKMPSMGTSPTVGFSA